MSETAGNEQSEKIYRGLARRCGEIGLLLWHCNASGEVLLEPENPSHAKTDVERLTRCMTQMPKPEAMEIVTGQWLVPIEEKQGSRRQALNVALVQTKEPEQVKRIGAILRWTLDELIRGQGDERTIEQFSEKLSQAYEETNLLYRMARLLNCDTDPIHSIETIGSQLQEVLPFGWMAIRFSENNQGVRDLSGKMIIAGEPPCGNEAVRKLTDPMLAKKDAKDWEKLLDPSRDPLAAATGAEVWAEPVQHDGKVIGMLLAGNKYGPEPQLSSFEMQFLDATAGFLGVFHENLARFAEQQELFFGTLRALTASIDAKDRYTCGHSERVGLMASKMAAVLGLDKQLVEQYRTAGLVHDVGKIGVPEGVLCKPGRLTDEEFAQIKLHPGIGYNILKDIPALASVLPGVLSHHERWDGRGYPNNLAGENIPLIARVLGLADTFDAMSSNRSYRPALPRQKVLEEILKCGGTQFDPQLAPIFVKLDFAEFDQALESHKDRDQKAA